MSIVGDSHDRLRQPYHHPQESHLGAPHCDHAWQRIGKSSDVTGDSGHGRGMCQGGKAGLTGRYEDEGRPPSGARSRELPGPLAKRTGGLNMQDIAAALAPWLLSTIFTH
jgi:hypothetical protein